MIDGKKKFKGAYGDVVELKANEGIVRYNGEVIYRGTPEGAKTAYDDKVFQVEMCDGMANAGPYGRIC